MDLWFQGYPPRLAGEPLPRLPDGSGIFPALGEEVDDILGWALQGHNTVQLSLALAEALADGGASPMEADALGNVPLDLAIAAENEHLVRFWRRRPLELATVQEDFWGECAVNQQGDAGQATLRPCNDG